MSSKPPLALEYIRALRDDRTLTTTEKLAAVMLASHAGHDGTNAHPGIRLLAAEIGLKERQTKTLVTSLVDKSWLDQTSSGRGNNRYASVYRLSIPQGATDCTLDASQG
ncbi:MAG: helix-turn-helix domain-containing protein, partial [Streptosporangiaceae bacterium]